jgi:AcrR family transcriptional regulator
MARKSRTPASPDALLSAALQLIADRGWRGFQLTQLSAETGTPVSEVYRVFADRDAVLGAFLSRLTERALALDPVPTEGPARDRLFDAAMQLFDVSGDDRPVLRVLAHDLARDPLTLFSLRGAALRVARWTLMRAGVAPEGLFGMAQTGGLLAILLSTLRVWLDDGPDQAKTMAALDRGLRRAEQAILRFSPQRAAQAPSDATPASGNAETLH